MKYKAREYYIYGDVTEEFEIEIPDSVSFYKYSVDEEIGYAAYLTILHKDKDSEYIDYLDNHKGCTTETYEFLSGYVLVILDMFQFIDSEPNLCSFESINDELSKSMKDYLYVIRNIDGEINEAYKIMGLVIEDDNCFVLRHLVSPKYSYIDSCNILRAIRDDLDILYENRDEFPIIIQGEDAHIIFNTMLQTFMSNIGYNLGYINNPRADEIISEWKIKFSEIKKILNMD